MIDIISTVSYSDAADGPADDDPAAPFASCRRNLSRCLRFLITTITMMTRIIRPSPPAAAAIMTGEMPDEDDDDVSDVLVVDSPHVLPPYPCGHSQRKDVAVATHSPLLAHGFARHTAVEIWWVELIQ